MAGRGGAGDGDLGVMPRLRDAEREVLAVADDWTVSPAGPDLDGVAAEYAALTLEGKDAVGASDVALVGGERASTCDPLKLDRLLGVLCGGFIELGAGLCWLSVGVSALGRPLANGAEAVADGVTATAAGADVED